MFRFAHISDLHIPPLPQPSLRQLAGKRFFGWLSWQKKRRHEHRAEVLEALKADLAAEPLDHVCVTGDLANISLPEEFRQAAAWLETLGDPNEISLVPGNHDAYVRVRARRGLDHWRPWMTGDEDEGFPWRRRRGGIDFIGLSSAVTTPVFFASGRLGRAQREALRSLLAEGAAAGQIRVLLIHHPPQAGAQSPRKHLSDAAALREVLAERGAELVLHGHMHRPVQASVPGPAGPIPVLGAGSGSARGEQRHSVGHYHRIELREGDRRLHVAHRRFDAAAGRFVAAGNDVLPGLALRAAGDNLT